MLLLGCDNESGSANGIKKIKRINSFSIILENGEKINLPTGDESVIFLIRPGEYVKDGSKRSMAYLTSAGYEYARKVGEILSGAGIQHAMAMATRYGSESVQPTADKFGLEVLTYNNTDYGAYLDYVFNLKKGQRFVTVETLERLPELLRTFTAGETFQTYPPGVYNKLYLIIGSERTNVKIHELHF